MTSAIKIPHNFSSSKHPKNRSDVSLTRVIHIFRRHAVVVFTLSHRQNQQCMQDRLQQLWSGTIHFSELCTAHYLTRGYLAGRVGLCREIFEVSRVGSGRVRSLSNCHGSGRVNLAQLAPRQATRSVKIPAIISYLVYHWSRGIVHPVRHYAGCRIWVFGRGDKSHPTLAVQQILRIF